MDQEYEERTKTKTRQLEIQAVSKALAFLSSDEAHDFTKVKKYIQDMVDKLIKEREDEIKHKDFCVEDELAKERTHDLEMNFNKIAPFGKEDTAKELQDHAAKTQDTLVDAVENAEVAEIKRAVFRALTRLRAATIKEFDTIARLETQAIDAYNDAHHYRAENPLTHLHEDEAPVETDGDVRPQAPTPQLDGSQEVILRCTSTYTEMRKGVAQYPGPSIQ